MPSALRGNSSAKKNLLCIVICGLQEKKTAVLTLLARNPAPSTSAAGGPQGSGVVLVTGKN
jgi:hypothetical protein